MEHKTLENESINGTWQQLNEDFIANPDILVYEAIINEGNRTVNLDIDIDYLKTFDGWIESTTITSRLFKTKDFYFSIHHENFLDKISAFVNLENESDSYLNLDHNLLVKTNDKEKIKAIFGNTDTKETFRSLQTYSFGIVKKRTNNGIYQDYLELKLNEGIIDIKRLNSIYRAFYTVLALLD